MGWSHGTYGYDKLDGFIVGLQQAGVKYRILYRSQNQRFRGPDLIGDEQKLRVVLFTNSAGVNMVCEEYVRVDNGDCDGKSWVDIAIYPQGNRPLLYTLVYYGGQASYPGFSPGSSQDFAYCINDGTHRDLTEEEAA